jgi:intracellular sulfur oxidation DsrE/DsrF family protein
MPMTRYVFVESRDPFESKSFATRCELARSLAVDGADVTFLLVENGVIAARAAAQVRELERLSRGGVAVIADEFALRERGVAEADLAEHVKPVPIDALIAQLGMGARVLWN